MKIAKNYLRQELCGIPKEDPRATDMTRVVNACVSTYTEEHALPRVQVGI